jgi:glyoxylase-like metal-dependent hydrolase (beta-lactamase superfamily II)
MHAPMYALRFANKKILPVSFYQDFEDFCSDADEPKMRSIHTPGHTRGSVCYVFDGFVMTGDTLLYKHVGRMDLPGSSIEEMKESVNNLLSRLSDEVLIFPGHGKPWTIGEAKSWWQERKAVFTIHNKFCQL